MITALRPNFCHCGGSCYRALSWLCYTKAGYFQLHKDRGNRKILQVHTDKRFRLIRGVLSERDEERIRTAADKADMAKEQVMKEVLYGDFIESYGSDYTIDVSFGRKQA